MKQIRMTLILWIKLYKKVAINNEDITDIRMIDNNNSYNELPTLTITSSSGNGAKVLAYITEIGRALTMKVVEAGL